MNAGNTERAPIESCLRRAHLAEAEKIWLSTHGEDFYRRMMAPKLPDLKMGDRVVHENRGAGTFEHYAIGRQDCFVKFDGEFSSERVTTSMVSLSPQRNMNIRSLTELASDLEHGGITKKLAARKLRDWIKENRPRSPPLALFVQPMPWPRPPYPLGSNVKITFSDGSSHVYGKEDGQIIPRFAADHTLLGVSVNGKELKSAINVEYL